jgi:nitroreductase
MERERLLSPDLLPENYRAWGIQPLTPEQQSDFRLLAENLVGYAILAASTHNIQPWEFVIDTKERGIEILVNKEKILPQSDPVGREAFISVGCALANFEVAAGHYGIDPQTDLLPQPDDQYLAAAIAFDKKGESQGSELFRAIPTRAVNRGEYDGERVIPEEALAAMRACVDGSELELHIITDRLTRNAIARCQQLADLVVLNKDDFRFELAELMLPNDSAEFIGMPGSGFGLGDDVAARLRVELKTEGRFDHDKSFGLAASDYKGITSSPVIGVICAQKDRPEFWIKAGQVWQRMALIAESLGINMAISAALVEVPIYNMVLKTRLRAEGKPVVVFRAGYSKELRPHSPRLPMERVTVFE